VHGSDIGSIKLPDARWGAMVPFSLVKMYIEREGEGASESEKKRGRRTGGDLFQLKRKGTTTVLNV
jgi:hypothetical protein